MNNHVASSGLHQLRIKFRTHRRAHPTSRPMPSLPRHIVCPPPPSFFEPLLESGDSSVDPTSFGGRGLVYGPLSYVLILAKSLRPD